MKKALKYIFCLTVLCAVAAVALFALHTLPELIPDRTTYAGVDNDDDIEDLPSDNELATVYPEPTIPFPEISFEPLIDAYKVLIDGMVVGIVSEETAVDDIICSIQKEYELNENIEDTICELSKEITIEKMQTYANNITDESIIEQIVSECVSFKLSAFELSVDGFVVGYFETKEECDNILEAAKQKYISQNFAGKTVLASSYDRAFDIVQMNIYKEELDAVSYNDAVDIIISERTVEKKKTVSTEKELKSLFSEKTVSDTCTYDGLLAEIAKNGKTELLYNERIVNFNVTVQSTKTSSIAFTTTYRANTSLMYNVSKTVKAGKNGTKTYTYSDTYVNGELVTSKLTSEKITAQPVGAIIEYGTKLPVWTSVKALTGKGIFKWPSSGFITSHFKSGGHTGIDIANVSGTPIYASADGTVKTVKNLTDGYGKYVVISHSNGYETYYAHMSKYIVKEGQTVKQGQIIGYVGMTGEATGNHCHFGIMKDGKFIDPTTMLYGYAS